MNKLFIFSLLLLSSSNVVAKSNVDISGVAHYGNQQVLMVSDELSTVFITDKNSLYKSQPYKANVELLDNLNSEADLEGLAVEGNQIYATGSHCLARKKVKDSKKYSKNQKRLLEIKHEPSRYHVFKFNIQNESVINLEKGSLTTTLKSEPALAPFLQIPSKENGVDIEGIAKSNDQLVFGFRGPVLRLNLVPILYVSEAELFDETISVPQHQLVYVNLEGNGVRDIVKVQGGFLILSGPTNDRKVDTQDIYFWDGKDMLPGKGSPKGTLHKLQSITVKGKAEGLTITEETSDQFKVLVVFDGEVNGGPVEFTIDK